MTPATARDSDASFTVRLLRQDEVDLLRDWAAAEGWNAGLNDGSCYFDTDPDGFFVGELAGQPISLIACVAYGSAFGFVGLYIVKPDFRGRGYGWRTWQTGLARLGQRNVGLDGVLQQQENYERSGFRFAHYHIRHRAQGGGETPGGLVPLSAIPFAELAAYDATLFPAPRLRFLRNWIALPGATALGCVRGGTLAGYGVVRPCLEGYKIGPLFAADLTAADTLFRGLIAPLAGAPVFLDTPDETVNPHASELVQRYGMVEVFRTARMYTRGAPPRPLLQVYGATSLELG